MRNTPRHCQRDRLADLFGGGFAGLLVLAVAAVVVLGALLVRPFWWLWQAARSVNSTPQERTP